MPCSWEPLLTEGMLTLPCGREPMRMSVLLSRPLLGRAVFSQSWPLFVHLASSVLVCVSLSQSCSLPLGITRQTGGCGWHLHGDGDN